MFIMAFIICEGLVWGTKLFVFIVTFIKRVGGM
jgi:hypothetical protein